MRRLCRLWSKSPCGQHALPRVAEGRVTEVVRQGDGLGELLVEPECARSGARELARLERVRQPVAVMVALVGHEDLGLVLEPAEGARVHDAVAIALERGAVRVLRLRKDPPPRSGAPGRAGGEALVLLGLVVLARSREARAHHRPAFSRSASSRSASRSTCSRRARSAASISSMGGEPLATGSRNESPPASEKSPAAASPSTSSIQRFTRASSLPCSRRALRANAPAGESPAPHRSGRPVSGG